MKKILVVDDAPEIVTLIEEFLGAQDFNVISSPDAEQAEELIKKHKPDIILLDILLPGTDGYELCQKIKKDEATKSIPVIFISILSRKEEIEKGKLAGADDYIPKPFDPKELLEKIKKFLK